VETYHVVLDTIDRGVGLVCGPGLVQVVLDRVHAQNANLMEGPSRNTLRKLAVECLDLLALWRLHGSVGPLVGKHLGRPNDHEPRRVARLHGGDEGKLGAGGEQVVRHRLDLFLGVVAVGRSGGPQDWGQQGAVRAEDDAQTTREGHHGARGRAGTKVVLHVGSGCGRGDEDDIVQVRSASDIVVEVVNDKSGSVGRERDVEFREEGDNRGRGGLTG
jgi:hypothetical protein